MPEDADVVVIGGGPVGENAAASAARHGLRVVLVERDLLGGECSYWACMPSKALLRPGEALDAAQRVPGAAAAVSGALDVAAALDRRDALSSHWDDARQVEWLEGVGVDLVRGHGRLTGERTVEVEAADGGRTTIRASRAVVVATGTRAQMPPIEGLDRIHVWDNRDVTTAKEVPRRLLVIGGGAVGVELAQAWHWLGSEEVTIVELFEHLLIREEPFAGDELRKALERQGVTVFTEAETTRLERAAPDAPVVATVEVGGGTRTIEADEVLVATGRIPATDDVGLEEVGLEPGSWLEVDDRLRVVGVDGRWLYAVGDVNGRSLLTHTGKYQGRVVGAVIAGRDARAWGDTVAQPRVVFTEPQVAAVGLLESQARERGIDVNVVRYDIGKVAGAKVLGRGYRGTCQLVVDAERRVIVGATFVGPQVGEMLHAATVAIVGEVPLERLWHAVPSFPTLSEVWLRLLERYRDEHGDELR
jgi:pyruvate/2-oxoglutarate dehydrogenase complex dihydrolipoamide dehydrogenase (E3) component